MLTEHRSLVGVLTGDSLSPLLWNIFFADLCIPPGTDDICLNGVAMCHTEQADDVAVFSTSLEGIRCNIKLFELWCDPNCTVISQLKTYYQIFGPAPLPHPILHVHSCPIEEKIESKYVGTYFTSTPRRHLNAEQYVIKAKAATNAAHTTWAMNSMVGALPPVDAHKLYVSRVDPHLIAGAEVALDVNLGHLEKLKVVQVRFLRHMLGLPKYSMYAPLFTETGLLPLRYRRVIIALRYLKYLVQLPEDSLAYHALRDSMALRVTCRQSWYGDLHKVLQKLPIPADLPLVLPTAERIDALIDHVKHCAWWEINEILLKCTVKGYMLTTRIVKGPDGLLQQPHRSLMPYMREINVLAHLKAYISFITSTHTLAVERLRHSRRYQQVVERHHRLCRLCLADVEDEPHAFLSCNGNSDLNSLRSDFLSDIMVKVPSLRVLIGTSDPCDFMVTVLNRLDIVKDVARYIYKLLRIYDHFPMYIPSLIVME